MDNEVVGVAAIGVGLLLVIGAVRGTWKKLWDDVIGGSSSSSSSAPPKGIGPTDIPNPIPQCCQPGPHYDWACCFGHAGDLFPHIGPLVYAPNGTAQYTPGELVASSTGSPLPIIPGGALGLPTSAVPPNVDGTCRAGYSPVYNVGTLGGGLLCVPTGYGGTSAPPGVLV